MFITLQFPFVDVRQFLKYPPDFVPNRPAILDPEITDFERIAKTDYVRCFGHYRLRGYIPTFKSLGRDDIPAEDEWKLLNLKDIWQDEYLYTSTKRALRFNQLEKQNLLDGKLCNPRAKVRALRFTPYDSTNLMWSPCMRIEIGILYDVPNPLKGSELLEAVVEFMKMKVNVPVYNRNGAGKNATVKKKMLSSTLMEHQNSLAKLLVSGTTAQHVLRVHQNMIVPGEPLISVHYSKDEIDDLPSNVISIPQKLTTKTKIGYHPLKNPRIGLWLFELPELWTKRKSVAIKRETIRNNTIAIMRYWAELQAIITLRNAVATNSFQFFIKGNKLLQSYVNDTTRFLLSGNWHGVQLDFIRNIINAHQLASPDRQPKNIGTINEFQRQIANKLINIGTGKSTIFVSYSHTDKEYLPLIQSVIATLNKEYQVAYFDDTYLQAGVEWERTIRNSLENASVAILLVSKGFLGSTYINEIEEPAINDRFLRGKLNIIPVLVNGTVPTQGFLSKLQFLNATDPLSTCTLDKKNTLMGALSKNIVSFL